MLWRAPASGIAMCHITEQFDEPGMSLCGDQSMAKSNMIQATSAS